MCLRTRPHFVKTRRLVCILIILAARERDTAGPLSESQKSPVNLRRLFPNPRVQSDLTFSRLYLSLFNLSRESCIFRYVIGVRRDASRLPREINSFRIIHEPLFLNERQSTFPSARLFSGLTQRRDDA